MTRLTRILDNGEILDDELRSFEVLRRLEGNDPSIEHIKIHRWTNRRELASDEDFERLGRAIASSTKLISLWIDCGHRARVLQLLEYVNQNRSVELLRLWAFDLPTLDLFQRLEPFLKNSDKLKCINAGLGTVEDAAIRFVMNALAQRQTSLDKIVFGCCQIDFDYVLSRIKNDPMINPKSVSFEDNNIGYMDDDCVLLSEIIADNNLSLEEIGLAYNPIGHGGLRSIATAIANRGRALKFLSIGGSLGWEEMKNGDPLLVFIYSVVFTTS